MSRDVDRVDLVVWIRQGAATLFTVLKRINEVTPNDRVNRRLVVDDGSTDDSASIAASLGWKVLENKGHGISDAANTALEYIATDRFASFEQDLLLAKDWWSKIPRHLDDPRVGVASGIRFASQPDGLRTLQKFMVETYGSESSPSWLRGWGGSGFALGKTLDNTIYKADVLRGLGGFPKVSRRAAGMDTVLAHMLERTGHRWVVDYTVHSTHLRKGLRDELRHQYFYGTSQHEITVMLSVHHDLECSRTQKWRALLRTLSSPFTGMFIIFKTHEPSILFVHPLIKFYYFKGLMKSMVSPA